MNNEIERFKIIMKKCRTEAAKRLIGQENLVDDILTAFIAGGHVLVEGVPGLAKTLAIKTIAEILGLDFKRIQFTPDLLPADVTGTLIYEQNKGTFTVRKGPVFANVILADEINRAPAKVQSAMLEAMEEHHQLGRFQVGHLDQHHASQLLHLRKSHFAADPAEVVQVFDLCHQPQFGNLLRVGGSNDRERGGCAHVSALWVAHDQRLHAGVKQLQETASNALMYIVVILLGTSVGATTSAEAFLKVDTLKIVALGLVAFAIATAAGVLFGKLLCHLTGGKINPLIGSAGVSAVPMAARVSQKVGAEADPSNFLLMHAMGPNVAGVIGTAVAAGVFMAIFGVK